jgi:lipopolysaccharide export system protein LptC
VSGSLLAPARDDHLASERGRAYAEARRHSARVRALRWAIPAGALCAAAIIGLMTLFNPFGRIAGLTLGPVSLAGTKITMENPRLTGFRKDSRPYEVTAKAALQDVRKPGLIELKDMRARLTTDEAGTVADLVSKAGLFDTSKELLDLKDEIRVTTSRGDEVLLLSASIDMKAGTVTSAQPVKITTGSGIIQAEGVRMS